MLPSTERDWQGFIIVEKIIDFSDPICVHIPTATNSCYDVTYAKFC
jgi:hypothetical protein